MRTSIIIPAHLDSKRFPRKVLAPLQGQPLLWHVWSRCLRVPSVVSVCITSDSDEIADHCRMWGAQFVPTKETFRCGSERVAAVARTLDTERIVNVQADEPFIDPSTVKCLLDAYDPHAILTPVFSIVDSTTLHNPNCVKVVLTPEQRAIYFSRAAVPYLRDVSPANWHQTHAYWGHLGVYLYPSALLQRYAQMSPGKNEEMERLEQLRFLDAGIPIQTVVVPGHRASIDTPADLEHLESTQR